MKTRYNCRICDNCVPSESCYDEVTCMVCYAAEQSKKNNEKEFNEQLYIEVAKSAMQGILSNGTLINRFKPSSIEIEIVQMAFSCTNEFMKEINRRTEDVPLGQSSNNLYLKVKP